MVTCRQIPDIASDYISREGSGRTRFGVALHLVQCRHCRSYIRGMKAVRRLAAQGVADPVPLELFIALGIDGAKSDTLAKEPRP